MDKQANYLNGDLVAGNFATFEVGSNVKNIRFINVNVRLDKSAYPNSYFMTVGPKSQYIAEKHLELFDPYVNCTVEQIEYRNICINDCLVRDLQPFIKEVEFNALYPSALPFGRGKLVAMHEIQKDSTAEK